MGLAGSVLVVASPGGPALAVGRVTAGLRDLYPPSQESQQFRDGEGISSRSVLAVGPVAVVTAR